MKRKTTIFLLLLPFLLITGIVLVSVWNVALQSLGYIPAFGQISAFLAYRVPNQKLPRAFAEAVCFLNFYFNFVIIHPFATYHSS